MFASRFFAPHYFAARYFAEVGAILSSVPPFTAVLTDALAYGVDMANAAAYTITLSDVG